MWGIQVNRIYAFFWMIICIVLCTMFFAGAWVPTSAQVGFMVCWFVLAAVIDFLKACTAND
ncbi:hypothetical protein POTTS_145 [Klebsiella phage vB_KpnM_Potts1]|uniref:Uncharacterized protein n=2 Tax=Marfavirus F48 TaxID=2845079 RepID=A0A5B9NIT9_9CAUD|nr:hypothetical protein POTTS_145 [Klebsiella phage vB_KpnM_Potts1]